MTGRAWLGEPEVLTAVEAAKLELEEARRRVATAAATLRADVATLTDLRRPIRSRPFAFVGGAFLLGVLLALSGRQRRAARGTSAALAKLLAAATSRKGTP
jgi:hypothetical protein